MDSAVAIAGALSLPNPMSEASSAWGWVIGGIVLVILVLGGIGAWIWFRWRNASIHAFDTEHGQVRVSHAALAELVYAATEKLRLAARPRALLAVDKKGIRLEVHITLQAGERLRETYERLRRALDVAIRHELGIENIQSIDVMVDSVKPARGRGDTPLGVGSHTQLPPDASTGATEHGPEGKASPKANVGK